jgi:hypothetical protein
VRGEPGRIRLTQDEQRMEAELLPAGARRRLWFHPRRRIWTFPLCRSLLPR